jgi:hypothetical protein
LPSLAAQPILLARPRCGERAGGNASLMLFGLNRTLPIGTQAIENA